MKGGRTAGLLITDSLCTQTTVKNTNDTRPHALTEDPLRPLQRMMSLRPAADDVAELSRGNGGDTSRVCRRDPVAVKGASRFFLTPSEPALGLEVGLLAALTPRYMPNKEHFKPELHRRARFSDCRL